MVNVRSKSHCATKKRHRTEDADDKYTIGTGPCKTQRLAGSDKRPHRTDHDSRQRLPSQDRHVHFRRTHEQGPTINSLERRSESPLRSALRDAASAQLLEEQAASQKPPKPQPRSAASQSPLGLESGPKAFDSMSQESAGGEPVRVVDRPSLEPLVGDSSSDEMDTNNAAVVAMSEIAAFGSLTTDASHDETVCRALSDVRRCITTLAETLPEDGERGGVDIDELLNYNAQVVRYIGCLAMVGSEADQSLTELLEDHACRQALVFGIVGRVLKEWVFDALWFGGSTQEVAALSTLEQEGLQLDGFFRTKQRAVECNKYLRNEDAADRTRVLEAKARITVQLEQLLLPLWRISGSHESSLPQKPRKLLARIVSYATVLNHLMRTERDVIYYWPPTLKGEEFGPARMECLNMQSMRRASPYKIRSTKGKQHSALTPGNEDRREAIVQIVCFPGLEAYRQGGGDLAARMLNEERRNLDNAPPDVLARRRLTGQARIP